MIQLKNYRDIRNFYYLGILILIVYAFPGITFIKNYIYPVLNFEIFPGIPVISIIAIIMAYAGYMAFKYRKIG